jgi:hypothetical protein
VKIARQCALVSKKSLEAQCKSKKNVMSLSDARLETCFNITVFFFQFSLLASKGKKN